MISQRQKEILIRHLESIKPLRIGIFGSYARGENKTGSDLDVLIDLDYSKQISLLDLVRVEQDLTEALGIPVDLVTERSLSPYLRPHIEKEVVYIQ
jgi:predicted nucleotidyltransferase